MATLARFSFAFCVGFSLKSLALNKILNQVPTLREGNVVCKRHLTKTSYYPYLLQFFKLYQSVYLINVDRVQKAELLNYSLIVSLTLERLPRNSKLEIHIVSSLSLLYRAG